MAGTNLNFDQIQAKLNLKEALKDAEMKKTIAAMEQQIAIEQKEILPMSI